MLTNLGSMDPSKVPSQQKTRDGRTGALLQGMILCVAVVATTCLVWSSAQRQATELVSVGRKEGNLEREQDSQSMFDRIQSMNQKLKAENKRMHKLLQMDETADMHVEAKLQSDADRERRRAHILRKQDDSLSEQLENIMSSPTHGAPERYASAYLAPERNARTDAHEAVDDAASELLRKEKARADEKLGLASRRDSERDLARDYLSTAPREEDSGSSEVDQPRERTPRERRKLERMEHQKYSADMKMAEQDLRNGHASRAKREARHALQRHESMEQLRGFEGREARKVPEAWRLLDRTIKDDLEDHLESQRVEDNMQDVVALHRDVESAKHEYEQEKRMTKDQGEAGRLALMLDVPSRDGGFKAEKEITHKLEKELNEKQRAWDRADALEAAKEAAARELKRAEEGSELAKHPSSFSAPRRRAQRTQAGGAETARKVHFVPQQYFSRQRTTQQLHSPPPAYVKAKTAKMELAQPHLSPSEHSVRRAQQAALGMHRRNDGGGQTLLAKQMAKAEVPHAASVALYRKDVGIRAKAADSHDKHSVRYVGVAKSVPKEPAQVSNDIVERLLKLAHAGKLQSPDVTSNVLHPISDALASHTEENQELHKQTEEYKAKLLAQKKAAALPQLALAKHAAAPMNPPVRDPKAVRAAERDSAAAAVKREEDEAAADRQAFALGLQQQMQAQPVPNVAAAAMAAAQAQAPSSPPPVPAARQPPAAAAPPRRMPARREAAERGGGGGGGGVWGLITAPFKAVFGDSVHHKVYLPT